MRVKTNRKKISIFLTALFLWCGIIVSAQTVWASSGKLSVKASASSVNIGDTVTITAKAAGPSDEQAVATMTLTFDSDILQFQECSSSVYGGGGNTVTVTGDSFTVTLKAIAAGKSKISLSGSDGVLYSSTEELDSMSGDSTSVTVNNSTSDNNSGGNDNGNSGSNSSDNNSGSNGGDSTNTNTGTDTVKSADNSLQTLTLSSGTLSPAFQYNVVAYTATVPNSVTNLSVTAVTSNKAATVESVTGNTDLAVGQNIIKIVVKAENGVTATYTVTVTREAASSDSGNTGDNTGEETPETENNSTGTGESISVDNVSYTISEDFAAEDIPADFTETTVTYHEASYKGLVYNHGTQVLLYLVSAEGTGKFFVYDETRDCFYPYVRLTAGTGYVIALYAPVNETIPDTYVQTAVSIGEETVSVYQAGQEETDFYLFYGINQEGVEGWYQYDKAEGTYQRLNTALGTSSSASSTEAVEEDTEEDESMTYLKREYGSLSETYAKEKTFSRTVMAILIFVIALLIVCVINLLLRGGNNLPPHDKGKTGAKPNREPRPTKQKKPQKFSFLQRPDDILDSGFDEKVPKPYADGDEDDFDAFVEQTGRKKKKEESRKEEIKEAEIEEVKEEKKEPKKKENIDVIDFNDF